MKALFVYEALEFERGGKDPLKSLDMGRLLGKGRFRKFRELGLNPEESKMEEALYNFVKTEKSNSNTISYIEISGLSEKPRISIHSKQKKGVGFSYYKNLLSNSEFMKYLDEDDYYKSKYFGNLEISYLIKDQYINLFNELQKKGHKYQSIGNNNGSILYPLFGQRNL